MNHETSAGEGEITVKWRHPALSVLLLCVCLITVAGNCLVVLAVCTKRYLRNPTGFLIISLAIADLIVGLVVMPLNSLYEMTGHVWLLGLTMCDIFHALDILASTSSIWNLCIISLDRYMAGRDPIGYRDKVSKRRIRIAIFFVWVSSAALAFPAIAFWRKSSPHLYENQYQCLFTDSVMYIGFSSLVSFYIPLCLILFAYGKVYVIATRHSRGLIAGVKTVKHKKNNNGETEPMLAGDSTSALRVHFGTGQMKKARNVRAQKYSGQVAGQLILSQMPCRVIAPPPSQKNSVSAMSCHSLRVTQIDDEARLLPKTSDTSLNIVNSDTCATTFIDDEQQQPQSIPPPARRYRRRTVTAKRRVGVKEKSRQMMKYVHEQRAARTLSIVVGAFILCWTPFFIFSPMVALCEDCFANKDALFTFFTWAGHLNSMLNPLIYSRFSRDFRRAFKQILTCQRKHKTKVAIKTPLSLVFTQLISITQFWEQPEAEEP